MNTPRTLRIAIFLLLSLLRPSYVHADIGNCVAENGQVDCVYTREGTDLHIQVTVAYPLTRSQLDFADSELSLLPASHLATLQTIAFKPLDYGSYGGPPIVFYSSAHEIDIQAIGDGNFPLKLTVRPSVGAHLFYTFNDSQKQQLRDLFRASVHKLQDIQVANLLGSYYAGWSNNTDPSLRTDIQTLIQNARTGTPQPTETGLSKLLTAASFFADGQGGIAFYQTPTDVPPQQSGQWTSEPLHLTRTKLQVGDYTLLLAHNQIIGAIDFSSAPTSGQPVYFQTPIVLPDFAWKNFRGIRTPVPAEKPRVSMIPETLTIPSSEISGSDRFIGTSPERYVPLLSTEGQKNMSHENILESNPDPKLLRRDSGDHPVTAD